MEKGIFLILQQYFYYLFEEPRHFAPKIFFRLCRVCLLPEYISEMDQIHLVPGHARMGRHSAAGSWEPPALQKPSAIRCHWIWQLLCDGGQHQQALLCYLKGVRTNQKSKAVLRRKQDNTC